MLRMVNLLIALSFGVHLEQLEQRTGLTWPLPFLLRPLCRKTLACCAGGEVLDGVCALGRSLLDHVGRCDSLTFR